MWKFILSFDYSFITIFLKSMNLKEVASGKRTVAISKALVFVFITNLSGSPNVQWFDRSPSFFSSTTHKTQNQNNINMPGLKVWISEIADTDSGDESWFYFRGETLKLLKLTWRLNCLLMTTCHPTSSGHFWYKLKHLGCFPPGVQSCYHLVDKINLCTNFFPYRDSDATAVCIYPKNLFADLLFISKNMTGEKIINWCQEWSPKWCFLWFVFFFPCE